MLKKCRVISSDNDSIIVNDTIAENVNKSTFLRTSHFRKLI